MKTVTKVLGVCATVGMFVVLISGANVTNTGSEHGCGRSWPLCNGQLIPQFAVSTAIEFVHRALVGVETTLILVLAAAALYLYGRRRDVQLLALLMVTFLFLQAGLGAWAVMSPQLSAVLALHFGVSLIDFASVLLMTAVVFEADGTEILRERPLPAWYARSAWGLTAYSYVVVYLGAYVRHTDADEACSGWPLCNGAVVPHLSGLVATAFIHRVAALLLVCGIAALLLWSYRVRSTRPDLFRAASFALGAVLLQAAAGAAVVLTHLDLFSALAHAGLAGLLFGSLSYLCLHVLSLPARRSRAERASVLAPGLQR